MRFERSFLGASDDAVLGSSVAGKGSMEILPVEPYRRTVFCILTEARMDYLVAASDFEFKPKEPDPLALPSGGEDGPYPYNLSSGI